MIALFVLLLGLSPPHFLGGPGWHVGSEPPRPCIGVPATRCIQATGWASTVPLRDCSNCLPHRTLAVLPSDGIVIQLTYGREQPPFGELGSWPVTLRPSDVHAGFEGVPNRFGVAQRMVRTGTLERSLMVWFGQPRPTARQLRAANAQLRTVR
jgi:hypothetical protein